MIGGSRLTFDEVTVFAGLVKAFYRRNGRDPDRRETEAIIGTVHLIAREMEAGQWLQ